jgi:hypothetical protein
MKLFTLADGVAPVRVEEASESPQKDAAAISSASVLTTPATMQGEKQFFKLLVLSQVLNMPDFMTECLLSVSPDQMFRQAKLADGLEFHQFHEWIESHMKRVLYNVDNRFVELEAEYLQKEEARQRRHAFR